jgi:pyruvate formate-lyase activating enzyme-like uncharacterized protein
MLSMVKVTKINKVSKYGNKNRIISFGSVFKLTYNFQKAAMLFCSKNCKNLIQTRWPLKHLQWFVTGLFQDIGQQNKLQTPKQQG